MGMIAYQKDYNISIEKQNDHAGYTNKRNIVGNIFCLASQKICFCFSPKQKS